MNIRTLILTLKIPGSLSSHPTMTYPHLPHARLTGSLFSIFESGEEARLVGGGMNGGGRRGVVREGAILES
jgi:hypothetical protein